MVTRRGPGGNRASGTGTERERAYLDAVRWLAVRSRTEAEVRRRLAGRGFAAGVIEDVIRKLKDLNYLDDQRYAERYAQGRLQRKMGLRRIALELKSRGIGEETVRSALEELDGDEEWRAALSLVRSRWRDGEDPPRRMRRLLAMLERRGYPRGLALKALEKVRRERGEPEADGDPDPFLLS